MDFLAVFPGVHRVEKKFWLDLEPTDRIDIGVAFQLSLNVTLPRSAVFFPGGCAPVDGIGLPGMVAFVMLVPSFLDPASVGKPRSKLL